MNFTARTCIAAALLLMSFSQAWATDYHHVGDLQVSQNEVVNCFECEVRSRALDEHSLVVSWTEPMVNGKAIYFRLLDIANKQNPIYAAVNNVELLGLSQEAPRIVNDADGFSIFWVADHNTVRAQAFDKNGIAKNASNTIIESLDDIATIEVTTLSDGNRLLVWSTAQDSETLSLRAVRVDSINQMQGDVLELASASSWGSGAISIVAMPQAEFWLAYEQIADSSTNQDGALSIEVRHFSADNTLLNSSTLSLNNGHDNLQIHSALMQDGGVRLIWISQDFIDTEIVSQRFNANGKAVGQLRSCRGATAQFYPLPRPTYFAPTN